ncbi:MAG: translocation/assembly module TamB domain-containing protein [Xanthomonadales bacterium]|nr:translocation/assembly module TamB domain-containing protein [Xanthomonadales bacterium]
MRRRWLRRIVLGLAVVLLALVLLVAWLGGTGSGLRFVLGRTAILLDDNLRWQRAQGSLLGGLRLEGVDYEDPAVGRIQADVLEISPRSRRLLGGELHLTGVTVEGVRVRLPAPAQPPAQAAAPFELPAIALPVALRIDALRVDGVRVEDAAGETLLVLDEVTGGLRWRGARVEVDALQVRAPEGELRLDADVDTAADWTGEARLAGSWQIDGMAAPVRADLRVRGPQSTPALDLALHQPGPATLRLSRPAGAGSAAWLLEARSDGIELADLLADPPLGRVAFALTGEGEGTAGALSGTLALDDQTLVLNRLAATWQDPVLVVESLDVAEADGPGRVLGNGRLDFSQAGLNADGVFAWQSLSPPLASPFQRLDSSGTVVVAGSNGELAATAALVATVDGRILDLRLQVEGDPAGTLALRQARLGTGAGWLEAAGTLDLAAAPAWDLSLSARGLDPGMLAPDWPGAVDLEARTSGALRDAGGIDGRLDLDRVGGTLRDRPLTGGGWLTASGERIAADLAIELGDNRLQVAGDLAPSFDAAVVLRLPEPGLVLEGAHGSASADLRVTGTWPALSLAGSADARALRVPGLEVAQAEASFDLRADLSGQPTATLHASGVAVGEERIDALTMRLASRDALTELAAEFAVAGRGSVALALDGRLSQPGPAFEGRLRELTLRATDLPEPLVLAEPAALTLSSTQLNLAQACLQAAPTRLCVSADWREQTGGALDASLRRLPAAWLTALAASELRADGELGGELRLRIDGDGALLGSARVEASPGSLVLAGIEGEADEMLVGWTTVEATLVLEPAQGSADIQVELLPAGRIQARAITEGEARALQGDVELALPDLSLLALLVPDLEQPQGRLDGRLALSGTLAAPRAEGELTLSAFTTELPALGLRVRDGTARVASGEDGRFQVEARAGTGGSGTLAVDGWVGLPADGRLPMDLRVTGQEVLVADLPAARVVVSPDLQVQGNARGLRVTGTVLVPQAALRPDRLELGAARPSPDIVVVDDEQAVASEAASALPVIADIEVRLGQRVTIEGYGLDGRLTGSLQVRERPRRPTTARGEIVVAGDYQAYGQDLEIERGRLVFAGGPIENPLLDIRAVRRVREVVVGLAVTGNAARPVLEVYSVPAMDQAEALSWLVLGRPLRQATSASDADLLGTAAAALTTAGGDLLARSLGARLGLDEVGVGSSRELGAGALTVGKYLSPRLYLGYGRSLFDGSQLLMLRYRLSERFELEASSGTREDKAGINYRYER